MAVETKGVDAAYWKAVRLAALKYDRMPETQLLELTAAKGRRKKKAPRTQPVGGVSTLSLPSAFHVARGLPSLGVWAIARG
jgi:hypothetical protein